jgi:hypothetical protein
VNFLGALSQLGGGKYRRRSVRSVGSIHGSRCCVDGDAPFSRAQPPKFRRSRLLRAQPAQIPAKPPSSGRSRPGFRRSLHPPARAPQLPGEAPPLPGKGPTNLGMQTHHDRSGQTREFSRQAGASGSLACGYRRGPSRGSNATRRSPDLDRWLRLVPDGEALGDSAVAVGSLTWAAPSTTTTTSARRTESRTTTSRLCTRRSARP